MGVGKGWEEIQHGVMVRKTFLCGGPHIPLISRLYNEEGKKNASFLCFFLSSSTVHIHLYIHIPQTSSFMVSEFGR